jgi:twinkle protein
MLSDRHIRGIENRAIARETAEDMGLYSGRLQRDGSVEPDPDGDVLCFPFYEGDYEVNTKYRWSKDGERRFMQRKGAEKTVFNANVLIDDSMLAALEDESASLIWTEGEFDTLATLECGYSHVISLPDGAMPGRDKNGNLIEVPDDDRDIDPTDDDKFIFMGRLFDRLDRVKRHIIATDNDDAGRRMAKELVRRIGAFRCYMIDYPTDEVVPDKKRDGEFRVCKDLNEVKQYLGDHMVREIIDNARPWPVKGLFKFSDYPDMDLPTFVEVGISEEFDEHVKFYPGAFVVATGTPNVGKSTLINQVLVRLAKVHKWPITMFSGEASVKPFLGQQLMTGFLEKERSAWSFDERKMAERFLERWFSFIDHDPRLGDDQDIDIDFLLEKAGAAVFRYGTRVLMIDPWNELEHKRPGTQSITEYTGDCIRKLKRFARSFDCMVIVVAHPTKLAKGEKPGLYSISDSAHWANKADIGLVVHAEDPTDPLRQILVPKIRHQGIGGKVGEFTTDWDQKTRLFKPKPF